MLGTSTSGAGSFAGPASGASQYVSTSTTGISVSTTNTATGTSGTNANIPPYYALCYIMKA